MLIKTFAYLFIFLKPLFKCSRGYKLLLKTFSFSQYAKVETEFIVFLMIFLSNTFSYELHNIEEHPVLLMCDIITQ